MPRIHGIGNLDWCFKEHPVQKSGPFGKRAHLRFRLQFDQSEWERRGLRLDSGRNEEVAFGYDGVNLHPGLVESRYLVREEDTFLIPSIAREAGRALVGHVDVHGVLVQARENGGEGVWLSVAWNGDPIDEPSGLAGMFASKINRAFRRLHVDQWGIPILNSGIRETGTEVLTIRNADPEDVERFVRMLCRFSPVSFEWRRDIVTIGKYIVIAEPDMELKRETVRQAWENFRESRQQKSRA